MTDMQAYDVTVSETTEYKIPRPQEGWTGLELRSGESERPPESGVHSFVTHTDHGSWFSLQHTSINGTTLTIESEFPVEAPYGLQQLQSYGLQQLPDDLVLHTEDAASGIDRLRDARLEFLSRKYTSSIFRVEDEARLKIATQRLREFIPHITDEQHNDVSQILEDIQKTSALVLRIEQDYGLKK